MTRTQLPLLLVAILVTLGTGATATAQQGVTVDPESPAAKEYAIPLEAARRAAGGAKQDAARSPAKPAPRFGEGVGDDDSAATGSSSGSTRTGGGRSSSSRGKPSTNSPPPAASKVAGYPLRPGAPDSGGVGTVALIVGGTATLLLLGGGVGYALRRRGDAGPATPS